MEEGNEDQKKDTNGIAQEHDFPLHIEIVF